MSCDNYFCGAYMKMYQYYTGCADNTKKLNQWPSQAVYTHNNDMISSEIDSKSWTPNKSLHISYVKCINEKGYDELDDIKLNAETFMKMLKYSAASFEVVELYVFNDHNTCHEEFKKAAFFYSIIFDKYRYKLNETLDIESILHILIENSKHIKNLTIDIADSYSQMMESLVKSSVSLESLTLLDCKVGVNFKFDYLPSSLKHLTLDSGELHSETIDADLSQLESMNLFYFHFKNSSFINLAKNLQDLNINSVNRDEVTMKNFDCLETLKRLSMTYCDLTDRDFEFLKRCKQLKHVILKAFRFKKDDKAICSFLNLPVIEELELLDMSFESHLSDCSSTLKKLHLSSDWYEPEEKLTEVFVLMPSLRQLNVWLDTENTNKYTDLVYKLMKSVLANSELTFVMYRKTFNNYGAGDIVVVEKDLSKMYNVDFDFESTFFLDFFPNKDVYEPFKKALEKDGLEYHIKCLSREEYTYKKE